MAHALFACAVLLLPAARAAAQAPQHATAQVDDPRSHGRVGDDRLSLNEAIRLGNGTLQLAELSPAEQQRIHGLGDVSFTTIEVPRVTLERDLDPILDGPTQHGMKVSGGDQARPVIDFGPHGGFVADGRFTIFANLQLVGGGFAITLLQDDTVYGSAVENCSFAGHRLGGVRCVLGADAGTTRLELRGNRYAGLPVAVLVLDRGTGRTGQLRVHGERVTGGGAGHVLLLLGGEGALAVDADRLEYLGTAVGFAVLRPRGGTGRRLALDARFVDAVGVGVACRCELGGDDGPVTFSQCDLAGAAHALWLGPATGATAALVRDCRLTGDVTLHGAGAAPLAVLGARARAGTWRLTSQLAGIHVAGSRLDGVDLRAGGSAAVHVDGACFLGGRAAGAAAAPLRITASYAGTLALGPHASVTAPLARPQLGAGDVAPRAPRLGATLELRADLPAGLAGWWLLGTARTDPAPAGAALRLYFDLGSPWPLVTVAGGVRLQQAVTLHVPNDRDLVGLPDWLAQLVVVPDAGVVAPPLDATPGRRFAFE
jgi:hypothetical protein